MTSTDQDGIRAELAGLLERARARTLGLLEVLDDRDVHEQYIEFMSPLVWDLGHVGNFEEMWLLRTVAGEPAHDPDLDALYNPFENPRWERGDLPLLPRREALAYLEDVRRAALSDLRRREVDPDHPLLAGGLVHRMLVQHESQHQETMLQALGLRTDLRYPAEMPPRSPRPHVDDEERVTIPGGTFVQGTDSRRWTYDNERPAWRTTVPTFAIDRFPVTARRFAGFIDDGGYDRPELWSERGWAWRAETGHRWPQGWVPDPAAGWLLRRFGHLAPLDPREPVQHVSYFEAEAFARWAGGRLPTETEWEKAAGWDPAAGRARIFPWGDTAPTPARANVGLRRFGPAPVGSFPDGASAYGVEQLAGDVYEWTRSPFRGYAGFESFPYREYSEVFFDGDYRVLRGSSWAIAAPLARVTYRNWDHPYRRQLMAGIRLVWDL